MQRVLSYDLQTYNFVEAAQTIFCASDLAALHELPVAAPEDTPPQLRRAQIQAQVGQRVSKAERKRARTHASALPSARALLRAARSARRRERRRTKR